MTSQPDQKQQAPKAGSFQPSLTTASERSFASSTLPPTPVLSETEAPSSLSSPPPASDYNDKFVSISSLSRTLTVKHFLLSHPTLVVPLSSIIYLQPAPQATHCLSAKAWGIGITNIGWARDFSRVWPPNGKGFQRSWVLKWEGSSFGLRAGFSVEREEEFRAVLEGLEPGLLGRTVRQVKEEGEREHAGYVKMKDL